MNVFLSLMRENNKRLAQEVLGKVLTPRVLLEVRRIESKAHFTGPYGKAADLRPNDPYKCSPNRAG